MKKLSYYLIAGAVSFTTLSSLSSCTSDLTSLNVDTKHPDVLTSGTLLSMGQQQAAYFLFTGSVNFNNYRFFVQQWAETTYVDETNYDLVTRNQPRNHYNRMMTNCLNNFAQAMRNLPTEGGDATVNNNKWATLEISQIYIWENLVDTYGDVPYSEALNASGGNFAPKYDDAKGIYSDLLKRIDAAIAKINTSSPGYSTNDLVYYGNMSKWVKFANSIKLRLAMNLADVDPATSQAAAEAAVKGGVMTSNADSYVFNFDGGTFTNPVYDDLVASGRNDFVPTQLVINTMNASNDPRRSEWFTTVGGDYVGGKFGSLNPFGNFSHMSDALEATNAPANLLSYTEVAFMLAEAAQRGYNVGGTAIGFYNKAIQSSMDDYNVAPADAAAYIAANPYDATNWKKSIGTQAWVAMFNRGAAAWNFSRRLDYPVFTSPANNRIDGVPVRMPYSDQEYVLNKANVTAAAAKIGGDKATTKLFWDKN